MSCFAPVKYNKLFMSQPQKLIDSIAYQSGTTVSKELLHNSGGSITLFAFSEGQALSEHTTPFDALIYIVEGEALITIDGVETVVKAGEILLMPANIPHALQAVKQFKMLLTMIKK